jgi:hypothetical protein
LDRSPQFAWKACRTSPTLDAGAAVRAD